MVIDLGSLRRSTVFIDSYDFPRIFFILATIKLPRKVEYNVEKDLRTQ